jgi:hypothetical protein
MAINVSITINGGADIGPTYNIFQCTGTVGSPSCSPTPLQSNVSLTKGTPYTVSGVNNDTTVLKVTSIGTCTSSVFLEIDGVPGPAPTPTPTATSTATPTPTATATVTVTTTELTPTPTPTETPTPTITPTVTTLPYLTYQIKMSTLAAPLGFNSASDACAETGGAQLVTVYVNTPNYTANNVTNFINAITTDGEPIYTDFAFDNPDDLYVGDDKWYKTADGTYVFQIGNDGAVSSVQLCTTPAPATSNTFSNASGGTINVVGGTSWAVFLQNTESPNPFTMQTLQSPTTSRTVFLTGIQSSDTTLSFILAGTGAATDGGTLVLTDGTNLYSGTKTRQSGTNNLILSFNIGATYGRTITFVSANTLDLDFS